MRKKKNRIEEIWGMQKERTRTLGLPITPIFSYIYLETESQRVFFSCEEGRQKRIGYVNCGLALRAMSCIVTLQLLK
jgi:hypothetical protein